MSEYRQDPLSRRWVITGSDRAARPNEFIEPPVTRQPGPCPFCAGNERETPEAVSTYALSGDEKWLVRVVPNKYPALSTDQSADPARVPLSLHSLSDVPGLPGFGRHEVIIESPRHVASFTELLPLEAEYVIRAYRDRLRQLKAERQYAYVQIFKNVGPAAGASLEHVHSQLLALPGVPEVIQQELAASGAFYSEHGRSLLGKLIADELSAGERIVAQTQRFVAFCPYASRFSYEVWVGPRRHESRFEDVEDDQFGELSRLMNDVIGRIERAAGQPTYNYFLHTQPFDMPSADHYHWHIEIIPRLSKVAGFEWGTGCFINPLASETAAEHLRAAVSPAGDRTMHAVPDVPSGKNSEAAPDVPMKVVDPFPLP